MCNGKIECWWVGKECIKLIPGSAMQRYALYNARIRTMQCKDAHYTMQGCALCNARMRSAMRRYAVQT